MQDGVCAIPEHVEHPQLLSTANEEAQTLDCLTRCKRREFSEAFSDLTLGFYLANDVEPTAKLSKA